MTCRNCICFLDDTDENGNLTDFHHSTREDGFCAMQDLFYNVKAEDEACSDFVLDKDSLSIDKKTSSNIV